MKKITDRFWLGIISGLGGNIIKMSVEIFFKRFGFKDTAIKKASGIFLKKKDVDTIPGNVIGFAADNLIAATLGVTCVYWLTLMGKDKYLLKGAGIGAVEWAAIYGVLSKMGATNIYPTAPFDTMVAFLSHLAFGATKITIATALGDSRLFKPGNLTLEISNPEEFKLFKREKKCNKKETSIN